MTGQWKVPANPIADQAAARNEAVPVGKTVREIRELGYEVPSYFNDQAILVVMPESPTGYAVVSPFSEQTAVWALAH